MHILHAIPCYWPARGGAQTHLRVLSADLIQRGHQVTIITTDAEEVALLWQPNHKRITQQTEIVDGVRVLRFPVAHLFNSRLSFPIIHRLQWLASRARLPLPILRSLGQHIPRIPTLADWLKTTDEKFDLVGAMHLPYDGIMLPAKRYAERHGVPFVVYPLTHFGTGDTPGSEAESQFYTMRHHVETVTSSTAIVAQTRLEADFYAERGMARSRIAMGGPGIDPTAVAGGDGVTFRAKYNIRGAMVLHLGTLSRSKGVIDTIKGVRQLWRQGVDVELVLAGQSNADFITYFEQLPSADRERIHHLGYVSEAERRDALAACTVLCLPSKMDSFGIVYLEAWLYKKPVIAARSWGVSDIVLDGETGLLVPFGEPTAVAAAIKRLTTTPELANLLGENGYQLTVSQHTWQHKCAVVAELYERLTSG